MTVIEKVMGKVKRGGPYQGGSVTVFRRKPHNVIKSSAVKEQNRKFANAARGCKGASRSARNSCIADKLAGK